MRDHARYFFDSLHSSFFHAFKNLEVMREHVRYIEILFFFLIVYILLFFLHTLFTFVLLNDLISGVVYYDKSR